MWKLFLIILTLNYSLQNTNCYSQQDEINNSVDFTFNFYRGVFDEAKNSVVSPISMRVLLSALYESTSENAEEELRDVMKFGQKVENLNAISENINQLTQGETVKFSNKIYLKNDGELNSIFQNVLTELKLAFDKFNFTNSHDVAELMNTWIKEQTNGLIKNLIANDAITKDDELVLINTIYFKARWSYPFNSFLKMLNFTSYNGESQQIDFMTRFIYGNTIYSAELKSNILELPYANGSHYVYWIIMPDSDELLKNVADKLNYTALGYIKDNFKVTEITVFIPKFEIEYDVDCVEALKKQGIQSIFTAPTLNMLNGKPNLKVNQFKQKSKIIVNTDGTEAVSSTYASITLTSMHQYFIANRPFIYLILTNDTLEPIFVGHFSNPF